MNINQGGALTNAIATMAQHQAGQITQSNNFTYVSDERERVFLFARKHLVRMMAKKYRETYRYLRVEGTTRTTKALAQFFPSWGIQSMPLRLSSDLLPHSDIVSFLLWCIGSAEAGQPLRCYVMSLSRLPEIHSHNEPNAIFQTQIPHRVPRCVR